MSGVWSGLLAASAGFKTAMVLGGVVVVSVVVAVPVAIVHHSGGSTLDTDRATVVRVIDGDTFDAMVNGTETRVRLLNVDTPETKDPSKPVECLGPEASAYLEQRLPAGTAITLEYDVERTDPYGRTLAGVFESGSLVDADIAPAGLGAAVVFGPNSKFYQQVLDAQAAAQAAKRGLYDPQHKCTLPARTQSSVLALQSLGDQQPSSATEATVAVALAAFVIASAEDLYHEIVGWTALKGTASVAAYTDAFRADLTTKLHAALASATVEQTRLVSAEANYRAEAKKKAEAEQKAETKRKAEAKKKAAEKREAEQARQAQAARKAAAQRSEAQRQQEARQRQVQQRRTTNQNRSGTTNTSKKAPPHSTSKTTKTKSNPYPGYHGPRCYEPGGKVWHPC